MSKRVLHLHIDRVVVEGLPASRQQEFVRALRSRLSAMADGGVADALTGSAARKITNLNAGTLHPNATADQAANKVVSAIGRSVAGGGEARHHG